MKKESASKVNPSKHADNMPGNIMLLRNNISHHISMHLTLNGTINYLIGTQGLGLGLGWGGLDSSLVIQCIVVPNPILICTLKLGNHTHKTQTTSNYSF